MTFKLNMIAAIIVAAGRGTRMGADRDKLFMEIAGRPVVAHTWARFDAMASVDEIVIVVREGMQDAFSEMAIEYGFKKPFRLTPGGKERQDSVWNGLEALSSATEIVAIQDGARPCATPALIQATIDAARQYGAAVAAQPVSDTIKQSHDGVTISQHLERSRLWAVQTPQTFRVEIIRRALSLVREKEMKVTDDTAACGLIGQAVRLVSCEDPNPKVTVPADVAYVEMLLNKMAAHD
jgi:2-C-methyl-D-erythritol 4-phosphate cytidylyltransferase